MKYHFFVFAAVTCIGLLSDSCFARKGGSSASGVVGSTIKSGSNGRPADHGGERGDPRDRDVGRTVDPARGGSGRVGPTDALGTRQGPKGVRSEPRIDLVTPSGGYSATHRGTIGRPNTATSPKRPAQPSTNIGAHAGLHPSTNVGAYGARGSPSRNAVGTIVSTSAHTPDVRPSPGGIIRRSAVGAFVPNVNSSGSGVTLNRPVVMRRSATGATVTGRSVSRIAYGPGPIGGPANNRSGVNGTTARRKF